MPALGIAPDAPPAARLRRAASGAAPTRVLLVHGLAGSPGLWRPWLPHAAAGLEIWDADLPWAMGARRSGGEDAAGRGSDAGAAAAAMAAVPGGPDVVVAHSYGATALLELLARPGAADGGPHPHPHRRNRPHRRNHRRPRAVVLVSPFYRPEAREFDWETMAYYLNGFHHIFDEGLRVSSGGRLPADLRLEMALRIRDRIGPYGWMRFFGSYLRTPFLDVGAVDVPVLVVGGDADIAAPAADARALARALPAGRAAVLEGCGHFPMAERPERFAALLHDFVRTLATPTIPSQRQETP